MMIVIRIEGYVDTDFFLALGAYIVRPCFDDQVYLREFRNHVTVFQSENYVKRPRLSPVDAGIIPYAHTTVREHFRVTMLDL